MKMIWGKQCYEDKDLADTGFQQLVLEARRTWHLKIEDYVRAHGDRGSCVLGAGIAVWYLAPKKRKPVGKLILHPPIDAQGSNTWEGSVQHIIDFLKGNDVDCWYEAGRMD